MSNASSATLVLRLAGPLQSWGERSQFNRRDTANEPTKSGIIGLLAAAQGRRRRDSIEDLLGLGLGVRVDQSGSLLRDYHTVSDYRGRPLLSASVTARGAQRPTAPVKATHVTTRYYLQDAVFVAAVEGPPDTIAALRDAVRRPAFPLALGRRACAPTQPLLLAPHNQDSISEPEGIWHGGLLAVLKAVPWQLSAARLRELRARPDAPPEVDLPVTVDDPNGDDVRMDLPRSFDPLRRSFTARSVRHTWVRVATPFPGGGRQQTHDPFALLGW